MRCTKCSGELPDGSKFCNHCGAAFSAPSPSALPSAPPPPLPPIAAAPALPVRTPGPDEPETQLWKGSISPKSYLHWWVLWALWVVFVLYVLFGLIPATSRHPWVVYTFLGMVALPALYLGWILLVNRLAVRYRLTTYRFFRETGIIARKIAELELIRVDDVQVSQNLFQRLVNVGTVTIISTDATDPRMDVRGIENPIEVKEQIRTCVRKRRGKAVHLESI